jgi:hypothetical protein
MSDSQYAAPVAYQAPRPTNVLAIIGLIASCLGFTIPGVVMGHIALSQIKRTGEAGHGLAVAALIVGYIVMGLTVLFVIGYVIVLVVIFGAFATSGAATQWQNFG